MKNTSYCAVVILASLLLVSCGGTRAIAPVSNKEQGESSLTKPVAQTNQPTNKKAYHQVRANETLYSIAWSYGYDPGQVAEWNNILPPYRIYAGQILQVIPPAAAVIVRRPPPQLTFPPTALPRVEPSRAPLSPVAPPAASMPSVSEEDGGIPASVKVWKWPAQGEVIQSFSAMEKGLSIAGKEAQPIYAAATGSVVYRGSGLIGLGELVIIKHDKSFLSAYAHNKKILVKEGDRVVLGQPIAEMGKTGTDRVKLYFEIRKDGKPVNPLLYLPRKN